MCVVEYKPSTERRTPFSLLLMLALRDQVVKKNLEKKNVQLTEDEQMKDE
jgi:hypothetical protein